MRFFVYSLVSIRIAMNRPIFFALLLCFASGVCFSQDYQICTQVIGSAGKSATQGGLSFSYTIGESVITTLTGNSRILTQGFHQPELCMPVSTHNLDLADWDIEVFPNPTADILTVRYATEKSRPLHATVFNLYGQVLIANQVLSQPGGTIIDCAALQPGVYLLHLQDGDTAASATVRFIRL